jgi:hypothetical protein
VKLPSALIVFRHTANFIVGSIGLSLFSVGLSATMKINQLLLSPPDPPICDVIISFAIINRFSDIGLVRERIAKSVILWFGFLIFNMVVHVSHSNGQCCLKSVIRTSCMICGAVGGGSAFTTVHGLE